MTIQTECYICGQLLDGKLSSDHIIPDSMFKDCAKNRPQLMVHDFCNNKKSKDDRWFAKKILFMCSATNKEAETELMDFLKKAKSQEQYAYLIGQPKSKVKDLKLVHTIFDEFTGGLECILDSKVLIQLKRKKELGDDTRLIDYVKQMCRGLFILNVSDSKPQLPRIRWYIYDVIKLRGKLDEHYEKFKRLFKTSQSTNFTQSWDNRIFYLGSRVVESNDKGYIYVEFFERVGIFAMFDK